MSDYTVLVVEDNPLTRRMVCNALAGEGYRVLEAGNGTSALAEGGREQPDFIVLDYVLPDTDGLQLLADLRRPAGREEIPALLVTGMASRLAELRVRAGALTSVMPKPLEAARILAAVGARLDLRGGQERPPATVAPGAAAASRGIGRPATARALPRSQAPPPGSLQSAAASTPGSFSPPAPFLPPSPSPPSALPSSPHPSARSTNPASARATDEANAEQAVLRQGGLQASTLLIMRSLTELLGHPGDAMPAIGDLLVGCLDAAGLSTGLLYLATDDDYTLHAVCGLAEARRDDAARCFGHPRLMRDIAAAGKPVLLRAPTPAGTGGATEPATAAGVPSGAGVAGAPSGAAAAEAPSGAGVDYLAQLGRSAALVVPFVVAGEPCGLLVMASDDGEMADASWLEFARDLASQLSRTLALGRSLTRVAASEERYRALMDQANDAILVLDIDLRILEANRATMKLLDRPREEVIGHLYAEFVVPEELEELRRGRDSLVVESSVRVPLRHLLRRDGSRVPVEVSASLVRIRNDSTLLAILHDITERRRLEAKLHHAQRMESVGRLAGGVAHDFNNLLTLILGYGNLVLQSLGDQSALQAPVEAIVRAGENAAALTRQLLAFSRRQVLDPSVLDVNELIRALAHILRRLIGAEVEMTLDLDPELAAVHADAGQVEQALINLASNARDAMPSGGKLTIKTDNYHPARPSLSPTDGPAQIAISVADTGRGIETGVMPHIFEPFFSTKEDGTATGLGLATVYGIVHQAGGRVEVTSQSGAGTTFTLYLPTTDPPLAGAAPAAAGPSRGTETILVAEDEALIRTLAREILEDHGYRILEAANADEALHLAAAHPGPIQMLLTDVVMLGKSGVELAQALLKRDPALRVVYMSGYADRALLRDAHGEAHSVTIVQKPFDPRLLAQQVRAALDQR